MRKRLSRGSVNMIIMGEKAAGAQIPLINPPPINLTLQEVEKSLETPYKSENQPLIPQACYQVDPYFLIVIFTHICFKVKSDLASMYVDGHD